MPPDFRFLDMTPQPDVIVAVRLDPARQAHGIYSLANARAAQARRHAGRGACRRRAHVGRSGSTRGRSFPGLDARAVRELANHPGRSPVEGRLGRRRREHVVGAHGCDRRRAADRLRQHRESHARAGGRAAAGVRRARRARRGAGANRERVARRELGLGRSRQRARLGARVRWTPGSRRHRPEQPAAPSGDRRLSARARVHRGRLARVDARVRLDHGAQARAAHRYAHDRRRARLEREPRAERDAQRVGRRAGGARARAGRERGAHDPNVSGAARRRSRVFRTRRRFKRRGSGFRPPCLPTPSKYTRMQHEILDKIAALPGVASAGFASHLPMDGAGQTTDR